MKVLELCFVLLAVSASNAITANVENIIISESYKESSLHPDTGLNIEQLLKKYGYPIETHNVTTEDGYILSMHRIPHSFNYKNSAKSQTENVSRPAVLLMHCIQCSSVDWVNIGPGKSLALSLADQGYDVWLGNSRGNTWSRKHITLDPDVNDTFWDFSFHEIGKYDLAAKIDYIINVTGQNKISFVGHSAGSVQFYVLMSTRTEYNDKIKIAATLAPATYISNTVSPFLVLLAQNQELLHVIMSGLKTKEILRNSWLISTVSDLFCNVDSPFVEVCADVIYLFAGYDKSQFNNSFLTVLTTNTPAGTSFKNCDHFLQEINSGHFRQYDYGKINNTKQYNSLNPPDYNTTKVTAPVAIYYAKNDYIVIPENVERLASELPNVVEKHLVNYSDFNHLDFLYANDVYSLVNIHVINMLNSYNGLEEIKTSTTTTSTSTTSTTTSIKTTTSYPSTSLPHSSNSVTNSCKLYMFIYVIAILLPFRV